MTTLRDQDRQRIRLRGGKEMTDHGQSFDYHQKINFRLLARALANECDLTVDEWHKSRRSLVLIALACYPEFANFNGMQIREGTRRAIKTSNRFAVVNQEIARSGMRCMSGTSQSL